MKTKRSSAELREELDLNIGDKVYLLRDISDGYKIGDCFTIEKYNGPSWTIKSTSNHQHTFYVSIEDMFLSFCDEKIMKKLIRQVKLDKLKELQDE